MARAEEIIRAVASLWREGNHTFSRKDVRDQIGVSQEKWLSGYTAIFQGMRADHPGVLHQLIVNFRMYFDRLDAVNIL